MRSSLLRVCPLPIISLCWRVPARRHRGQPLRRYRPSTRPHVHACAAAGAAQNARTALAAAVFALLTDPKVTSAFRERLDGVRRRTAARAQPIAAGALAQRARPPPPAPPKAVGGARHRSLLRGARSTLRAARALSVAPFKTRAAASARAPLNAPNAGGSRSHRVRPPCTLHCLGASSPGIALGPSAHARALTSCMGAACFPVHPPAKLVGYKAPRGLPSNTPTLSQRPALRAATPPARQPP